MSDYVEDSMTTNNLRDSAKGTFVTLDDSSHFTGYEPNAMELTNVIKFNDSVPSNFTDFQDSLVHIVPSSDHDVDDETLGKLLAEVHRDYADYRCPEGVSVSPSSTPVMVDRTGELLEERIEIAEERESSSVQIRTLIDEQRRTIISECCEKVSHHELLAARAEQERKILQEESNHGVNNRIFVKFINKILQRWRNCKNSRVLPSMRSPDRNSSRIRTLLWNYQAEYKNCTMKCIVWTILRILRMPSRCAVEIHTSPVNQEYSLNILLLKDYWGFHSYRSDTLMGRQIFGIHLVYQETFLHIHKHPLQLRILKNWYVLVPNFLRKRCNGSRKWSWLIQWMNWDLRHLLVIFQCRILKYLMRRWLQHWTKSSIIPTSKEESVWRNKKVQKQDRFLRGRQIAYLIYDQFWVTGTQWFCRELCRPIHYQSSKRWYSGIRFKVGRNFIVYDENPTWRHLGKLYKLRIRESEKLKTVLELYDLEIHQKKLGPDCHRVKAMVKRSSEQEFEQ